MPITPLCTPDVSVKRDGPSAEVNAVRCKRWSCEICAQLNRRRIIALARMGRPTAMLTLTVSNKNYPSPVDAARDLKRGLVALRKRIARAHPGEKTPFLVVYEKHKSGWPHMHLLIRAPFLPVRWLRRVWEEITGSFMVDIRAIRTEGQAAFYVTKYVGKDVAAFEGCKRWWRSHDYNEPREMTDADRRRLRGWSRHEGNINHLHNWLRHQGVEVVEGRDGRLSWKDPPCMHVDVPKALRAADSWYGHDYRRGQRKIP